MRQPASATRENQHDAHRRSGMRVTAPRTASAANAGLGLQGRASAPITMSGTLYPQWAVGLEKPFAERMGCRFRSDTIVEVTVGSPEAVILRDMMGGGRLIELDCGFNPRASRHTVYPAGSSALGALHFGIDLAQPSEYSLRPMPRWEEPPVHMNLVTLNSMITADGRLLVEGGSFFECPERSGGTRGRCQVWQSGRTAGDGTLRPHDPLPRLATHAGRKAQHYLHCSGSLRQQQKSDPEVAFSMSAQVYFFLTWLADHLPAKACRSFSRLSRSAPSVVTV